MLTQTAHSWSIETFRIFPLINTGWFPLWMVYSRAKLTFQGCNMFTDICFATLPIPIIWRLQMKRRTRIYLIGVFSLGYIAVFIGVAKAVSQVVNRGDPDAVFHNWTQTLGL